MRQMGLGKQEKVEEGGRRRKDLHPVKLDRRGHTLRRDYRRGLDEDMPSSERPPGHVEPADMVEPHERQSSPVAAGLHRNHREERSKVVEDELRSSGRAGRGKDKTRVAAFPQFCEEFGGAPG